MIDIEDLVRKQIALYRAYDVHEENVQRAGRGKQGKLSFGPYLLISREKGAGGSAVGLLAGARLGWQVFDNKLVGAIAEQAHVRRELIESLDERDRKTIGQIVSGFIYPPSFKMANYVTNLREVVLALGHQGNVVMVGRGAQYILPTQFGLRARLVAPMDVRVRRIASENKMTLKAAQIEVEKSDVERASLTRRYYDQDMDDPLNSDILINTAELTVEAAAEIVVEAVRRKLGLRP
jgi:hypothetical protein